ncbi:MAG: peptide ABC transporter substrate-binding protein [Proteobacteria bacterium]|nr:peptide ABC transporter substrate-binding protein [Pseudomonadota bacterium]
MQIIGRSIFSLLAALLLWPAAAPDARAARDELVIGMTQFPATFSPIIDSMLAKSYVLAMTRRPLVTYDQSWELACMLCTELPTIENGLARRETLADGGAGMALTYTIQPGATWGDGTPVTTEDVVFSWEVGGHPLTGVANRDLYERITAIDVHDDKRFTVHLDKLFYDYPDRGSIPLLPAHLERAAFADPREYRHRTLYDSDPTNPGLYYGPYRITEIVSGSHVVLEPNPTWWGDSPHFKRIVVRVIENTAALEANLLSGGIDYVAGELGFSIDQALSFERRHGDRFNIFYKPGLIYEHIDLNLDNPMLADRRVRRALLYALDRERLVAQLFGGQQPVAHSNVNPLDWVYSDEVPTYAYDPAKAAALLDEAGWGEMRDGIRHNAAGERLTLRLMTTAGNKVRELVEQVLQSQWKKVGVEITIKNEPARVFFGQTVTRREFPAFAMYAWLSSPESVPRSTLHSGMIPTEENNWSGQNNPGFVNAEMDALIEKTEVELDREVRRGYWRRMQQIYAEELPVLPLYFRAEPYILPPWLTGVEPTGHQVTTTLWVERWGARE